tara:strand:+ start:1826 stop:2305 length:480 start_codon:yes stop_codon:yes gene_type:complete
MAQAKKIYDFKSVGNLQSKVQTMKEDTAVSLPIGILTPISFEQDEESMFKMSKRLVDQVRDNMKNLLSTNHGERLMLTDYGANLKELSYDMTSNDVIEEALARISAAVTKYLPYVSLETFETSATPEGDVIVNTIKVGYSIPSINATNQIVEVSIVVAN